MSDIRPPSRRQFLAVASAAWATASLWPWSAPPVTAQTRPADRALGWAVVGLGGFARNELLPGLSRCRHSNCVAVVTGHPEKVDQPNHKLGGKSVRDAFGLGDADVYSYDSFDSIRDNRNVDVVYVVLPNGMHCEYAVRALKAGKHVVCEKPMANTVAECDQMLGAAKAAGKRLQVGYRMHWDAPTNACIAALRRGDIGKLQVVEAAQGFNIGPGVWRLDKRLAGGGCMMDIGIYALSAARYLSGEEPTEVFAHTFADRDDPRHRFDQVEGTCDFQLRFPSGLLASCTSSYACSLGRFAVHGSGGTAVMEPSSNYNEPPAYGGTAFKIARGYGEPKLVDVPPVDQFIGEIDGFSLALKGFAPFRATGEEGRQDMKIIEAIYTSARIGRAVALA